MKRLWLFLIAAGGAGTLGGCCLTTISGDASGSATSSTTTGGAGTTGASNSSSGTTTGALVPCAVRSDMAVVVTTLAGSGAAAFSDGSGGRNGDAQFNSPSGVLADALGNVYVADYFNFRIRKIDSQGNTTTLAGNGVPILQDGTGGPTGTASFDYPVALTFDTDGGILVVDVQDHRVRRVDRNGDVTTLPCEAADGLSFLGLFGIAVDATGNILIADSNNSRICTTDPAGSDAMVLATGSGAAGAISFPLGVAVGPDRAVYVADEVNNVIFSVGLTGRVLTFSGNGKAGFADGPGTSAQFYSPCGLAFDPAGNLVVADATNNRIRVIDPAGNVTTLAGDGQPGDVDGTGGANGTAEFNNPIGVAVDANCNIYVADENNNRIREISVERPE